MLEEEIKWETVAEMLQKIMEISKAQGRSAEDERVDR